MKQLCLNIVIIEKKNSTKKNCLSSTVIPHYLNSHCELCHETKASQVKKASERNLLKVVWWGPQTECQWRGRLITCHRVTRTRQPLPTASLRQNKTKLP